MTINVKIEHKGGPYIAVVTGRQYDKTKVELKEGDCITVSMWNTSPPIVISEKVPNGR